ncbi:MAG: cation transporter [Candidatus Competibacteraceae bacterium]|nr:cation transporter [Candidatus Competibacteraceae bacterium]
MASDSVQVTATERYRAMRNASLVGAAVNIFLAASKIVFGFISQSHALIADGLHSLSDLATDLLVAFAARHSTQGADEDHPYGHARIETAATVGLGLLLMAVAIGIILDAGQRLLDPASLMHPQAIALAVALVSVLANEWLYFYTRRIARRIRSPLLRANAWHHRTDSLSSVVVFIGVAGTLLGLDFLDAFASVVVALMIAKIGWNQAWQAIQELIDQGLQPEQLSKIRAAITEVQGVKDLHMLRTRRMGNDALVDVHVQVDPRLSVSEGHQIGEYVRTKLVQTIDEVSDVTVHIDSEDDADSYLCAGLPLRQTVTAALNQHWQSLLNPAQIRQINLHYLSGRIHVDLLLELSQDTDLQKARQLAQDLKNAVGDIAYLGRITIYFTL